MLRFYRESKNGYEVCNMIESRSTTDWSWIAGRIPMDINDTTPTEKLKDFTGMSYAEILAWFRDYMNDHPDDGIYVD